MKRVHPDDEEEGDSSRREARRLKAISLWEEASTFEAEADTEQAVDLYRQALKIDPDVEQEVRKKIRLASSSKTTAKALSEDDLQITNILNAKLSKKGLSEGQDEDDVLITESSSDCYIFNLPDEVLAHICIESCINSCKMIKVLSLVCKRFCRIVSQNSSLWQRMMQYIAYDTDFWYSKPINERPTIEELQRECEELYNGQYKHMVIDKPQLRFNGVYIATCKYLRKGEVTITWNKPVQEVKYYRYLRFFQDGTVLMQLSPKEPLQIVYNLNKAQNQNTRQASQHTIRGGSWVMNSTGQIEAQFQANEKHIYHLSLTITSSARGQHNKLHRNAFWSYNTVTNEITEFADNGVEGSYVFSPVLSYMTISPFPRR